MLKILNLLDFTPLTYTVFCTLPPQVQNPAMYPVCFIFACNVHFLSQDITFFFLRNGMCFPRDQEQNDHFFNK